MRSEELFRKVFQHESQAIALLSELVAIPSIAGDHGSIEACAKLVEEIVTDCGLEAETWRGEHAPVIFGQRPARGNAPTLLFYGHYDVQPAEPLDLWESPPFEPTVREGALFGRGAADNKGQLLAHLMAIGLLREVGALSVGIKVLIEGEEEIGSPNLADVARRHREQLVCDLALTADGPYHDDGRPIIIFGVRGLLYLEIRLRGANRDVHSGNRGGWAPSPAWNLVHALASLRDPSGEVLVPEFYDTVRAPTSRELQLLQSLPLDRDFILDDLGLDRFPRQAEQNPWEALMFRPTLNICGITTGHSGPGTKTIIPAEASAKIDVRLVADQQPRDIEEAIRRHLTGVDADIEIRSLAVVPPSATSIETPFREPVAAALAAATGLQPWLRPRLGGTTPDYVFTEVLGVPSLLTPYASPDMNNHAPNEKMTLEALSRGIRSTLAICELMNDLDVGTLVKSPTLTT